MKRAAERQLTKDDDDADDSQDEGTRGFQMADPASLSERTIRGLPKRAFGVVPANPSPQPNAGANAQPSGTQFQTFPGFGNNAPSPFTFSANVPTSAAPQSSAGAKPLNGIFSSASPAKIDKEEAAVRYCLNLRGLNVSFLETITKAVEADSILDISATFEQYTKFRSNLEKNFTNETNPTNPSFGFSGSVHTAAAPSGINSDSTKPSSISTSSTAFDNKAGSKTPLLFGSTTTGLDTKPSTSLFGKLPQNPTGSSGKLTGFGFEFKSTSSTPLTPGFSAFTTDLPSKPSSGVGSPSPYTNVTGSIGNPVGFGFGSLPTTPSAVDWTKSPSSTTDDDPTVPKAGGTEETGKGSPDAKPSSADANPYDVDGAGEEGETTIFESKAKAYKMTQKGDKAEWEGVGTGQLKLKAHQTGRRRLLMRNSSNGKVILNFNLYTGFKTAHQTTKSFSFRVPGKGDSAAVYSIRVGTSDDATKWQKTVEDEVDALAS